MGRSLRFCSVFLGFFGVFAGIAHADTVAGCNYTFAVGPYEDRGSVLISKNPQGYSMKVIQDDQISQFDRVNVSSASGDQARELIKQDGNFKVFAAQARIFPDDVVRVDEYVVGPKDPGGSPQASFFAFYGKDNRYLGGFGIYGKTSYVCDWV
jgi:hypothetical protein